LIKLQKIIHLAEAPWWSDHLCFTKFQDVDLGHLAELPFIQETVDVVSKNIKIAKDYIDVPMILENITYTIGFELKEMSEHEFFRRILEKNDCGMLLDVTNLYANCLNHKYNPFSYLDNLPLEKVIQLHFVGGHFIKCGEYIDSHSHKTPEDIWKLLEEVVSRCSNLKGIILERDGNFPDIEELLEELERAREIGRKYKRWI
jgi:uncharacterized protein (UPF0276 family)